LHAVALGLRSPALASVALVLWSAVALLATASAVRFALRGPVVQTEHVHAALSAYLLAGVFAGVLYFALEHEAPGSLLAPDASPGTLTLPSAIYFSFVTLATVGYGDIVPRTDLARGLAIFEATAGQLYLVVMVARLVSLHARSDERAR
ncbi:MAG: potassium channel family protein, partial [Thermodesulfobacteriota bacterium]